MSQPLSSQPVNELEKLKNLVLGVHILYAASFVLGFTSVVGLVIAYMKRPEAAGTIWESHFSYAIRTFWIGLAMGVVGVILIIVGIGVLILIFGFVWYIVRVVRAFLAWNDNIAIANPKRFF